MYYSFSFRFEFQLSTFVFHEINYDLFFGHCDL